MEQFKVCEKETKTKKFSKEGLAREAEVRSVESGIIWFVVASMPSVHSRERLCILWRAINLGNHLRCYAHQGHERQPAAHTEHEGSLDLLYCMWLRFGYETIGMPVGAYALPEELWCASCW